MTTSADIKIALEKQHRNSRDFFMTEVKSGSSYMGTADRILDAVAIKPSYAHPQITGYEVKISRSDFKGDAKFYTYLPLVHALYIACPTGLIDRDELPVDIGLIWYNPDTKALTVKKRPPPRKIEVSAQMLQYIIYSRLDPDRVPFYSDKAEWFKAWLQNKHENRDLAYRINGQIYKEIKRLEDELRAVKSLADDRRVFDGLMKVLKDAGYYRWDDPVRFLKERLTHKYPKELDYLQDNLETALRHIKQSKEDAGLKEALDD